MKYVRMLTGKVPIDKFPEFTRLYEQTILPTLKPVSGFLGAYLFTDPTTGEGFSLTFWRSEQDAITYEKSGLYARLLEQFRPFFATQPILKTYQVAVELPISVEVLQ
jgi:heme-degrading monooxygenase HmoA